MVRRWRLFGYFPILYNPLVGVLQRRAITPLEDPSRPLGAHLWDAGGPLSGDSVAAHQHGGGGGHVHVVDSRNRRTLVGIRDGVSGRFTVVPRAEAKVRPGPGVRPGERGMGGNKQRWCVKAVGKNCLHVYNRGAY
jgi:hypothetical protein